MTLAEQELLGKRTGMMMEKLSRRYPDRRAAAGRCLLLRVLLLAALAPTLATIGANAQSCPALTVANFGSFLDNTAIRIDNENSATTALSLTIDRPTISRGGAFSGWISSIVNGQPASYAVHGTITQPASNVLTIAFTYAASCGGTPTESELTYHYTGSIAVASQAAAGQQCSLFVAGTFTRTSYSVLKQGGDTISVSTTTGPYPFSGMTRPAFN